MGIRSVLSLPVLDLLGEFILLDKEDKNAILEHQAKLLSLYWGQQEAPEFSQKDLCKVPRYGKSNNLMLEAEMTRLNVTSADVRKARKAVISRAGMPPDVPLIGKIAIDLEYIENDFLEALVKGQAGEAILKSVKALQAYDLDPEHRLRCLIEPYDEGQIARNYIGKYEDDSAAVITAQACQHLADLCIVLFDIEKAQDMNRWITVCEVFFAIGYLALQASADHLAALGHLCDAREIYMTLPDTLTIELHNDTMNPIKDVMQQQIEELYQNEEIDDMVYNKAKYLLKKRFEQIDLSTLLNVESQHEDFDLKERLRMRLSSVQE